VQLLVELYINVILLFIIWSTMLLYLALALTF
jgi:hypothetical protein